MPFDHLRRLEAESIHIFREAVAEAQRPVMLFSAGKDSVVMLHLARKAFFPMAPPRFLGDLGFVGNRLPDREARVDRFLFTVARELPLHSFVLCGAGWGEKSMPTNVRYLDHLYTHQHNSNSLRRGKYQRTAPIEPFAHGLYQQACPNDGDTQVLEETRTESRGSARSRWSAPSSAPTARRSPSIHLGRARCRRSDKAPSSSIASR